MTLAEQYIKKNHYIIALNEGNDVELFVGYMLFLQRFCTYHGMCGNIQSDLTDAMVLLARKYVFPVSKSESNVWMQKLEQCEILQGKPLFQFAVCDIAMMTAEPEMAAEELLVHLPNIINESELEDNTQAIAVFYNKCERIISNSLAEPMKIKKSIETSKKDFKYFWKYENIIHDIANQQQLNKKNIENCLLYVNENINCRMDNNAIIAQKMSIFKLTKDYYTFYQYFSYPVIIDKKENNNLEQFVFLNSVKTPICIYKEDFNVSGIIISNYRNIRSLNLKFSKRVNIFVGKNGVGKTNIINAMNCLLSYFVSKFKAYNKINLYDSDIMEKASLCSLDIFNKNGTSWKCVKSNNNHLKSNSKQLDFAKAIENYRNKSDNYQIPIVASYYCTHLTDNGNMSKTRRLDKFEIYDFCFKNVNIQTLPWLLNKCSKKELAIINDAIEMVMVGYSDLKLSNGTITLLKNNKELSASRMSDGEKCCLTLVTDIARRLSKANPRNENPLHGHGIVLIDEIDLHLHPKWQREIISRISMVFPNIQFFITCNSVMAIQSMQNIDLYKLGTDDEGCLSVEKSITSDYTGRTNDEILDETMDMGGDIHSDRFKRLYGDFVAALDENNEDKAYKSFRAMSKIMSPENPMLEIMDVQLKLMSERYD